MCTVVSNLLYQLSNVASQAFPKYISNCSNHRILGILFEPLLNLYLFEIMNTLSIRRTYCNTPWLLFCCERRKSNKKVFVVLQEISSGCPSFSFSTLLLFCPCSSFTKQPVLKPSAFSATLLQHGCS